MGTVWTEHDIHVVPHLGHMYITSLDGTTFTMQTVEPIKVNGILYRVTGQIYENPYRELRFGPSDLTIIREDAAPYTNGWKPTVAARRKIAAALIDFFRTFRDTPTGAAILAEGVVTLRQTKIATLRRRILDSRRSVDAAERELATLLELDIHDLLTIRWNLTNDHPIDN